MTDGSGAFAIPLDEASAALAARQGLLIEAGAAIVPLPFVPVSHTRSGPPLPPRPAGDWLSLAGAALLVGRSKKTVEGWRALGPLGGAIAVSDGTHGAWFVGRAEVESVARGRRRRRPIGLPAAA
jgi:hypothetical protein